MRNQFHLPSFLSLKIIRSSMLKFSIYTATSFRLLLVDLLNHYSSCNTMTFFLTTMSKQKCKGFLYSPDPDLQLGLQQKLDPRYQNSGKASRTVVKQKTDPIFRGLIFQNKYIDAVQKYISVTANCLRQKSNGVCTLELEVLVNKPKEAASMDCRVSHYSFVPNCKGEGRIKCTSGKIINIP